MRDWKRREKITKLVLVGALAMGLAGVAKADPILMGTVGPSCGSCQGGVYSLFNLGTVVAGTTDILYRIDTTGYSGTGTFIDAAAIKVLSSMAGTTLVAAPPSGVASVPNWTIVGGSLNAGGCLDNPGDAFACTQDIVATGGFAAVGGILEWVFRVPATGGFIDPPSIKARYVDDAGNKVGALVSENTQGNQIPEPSTLLLLGSGLLAVGRLARKKKR